MKKSIIVTWQFEGFHAWPSAPDEVEFLRHRHRHIFKCVAKIEVFHSDRELEFFMVKRELISVGQPVEGSCEEMAEWFVNHIIGKYGERKLSVEVWEDGENAGIAEI